MATLLRKTTVSLSPSTGRHARLAVLADENGKTVRANLSIAVSLLIIQDLHVFQTSKHTKGSAFVSRSAHVIRISQLTSPEKPNQPVIERENEIPLPAVRLRI